MGYFPPSASESDNQEQLFIDDKNQSKNTLLNSYNTFKTMSSSITNASASIDNQQTQQCISAAKRRYTKEEHTSTYKKSHLNIQISRNIFDNSQKHSPKIKTHILGRSYSQMKKISAFAPSFPVTPVLTPQNCKNSNFFNCQSQKQLRQDVNNLCVNLRKPQQENVKEAISAYNPFLESGFNYGLVFFLVMILGVLIGFLRGQ